MTLLSFSLGLIISSAVFAGSLLHLHHSVRERPVLDPLVLTGGMAGGAVAVMLFVGGAFHLMLFGTLV